MTLSPPLLITGGRVLDPAQGLDMMADVLVEEGKIAWVLGQGQERPYLFPSYRTLDATGLLVCPGFIDLHCHLREPGQEAKETIASGTAAAARGGFTTICCMPNTEPTLDSRGLVEFVLRRAERDGAVRVLPIGAVTRGRRGVELVELYDMAEAGAIGFSDDGNPVADARLLRQALTYCRSLGLPIIDHPEDRSLSAGGVMHEGWVSARLGLPGVPAAAEETAVARDIALAHLTEGRLHLAHLSTARSVELVRRAKAEGLPVTAEVAPHHLALTHEWILGHRSLGPSLPPYDTLAKVNPPLRTPEDCQALLEGLRDGTIDAIATDHAPHTVEDKLVEFGDAAVGISGLETAAGLLLTLVHQGKMELTTLVAKLTAAPATLLPAPYRALGALRPGAPADLVLLDPAAEWVVDPAEFRSKGRNTPLAGCRLTGRVMATVYGGAIVHQAERLAGAGREGGYHA